MMGVRYEERKVGREKKKEKEIEGREREEEPGKGVCVCVCVCMLMKSAVLSTLPLKEIGLALVREGKLQECR